MKKYIAYSLLAVLFASCAEDVMKELLQERTPIEVKASFADMNMPMTTRSAVTDLNSGGFTVSSTTANNKVYLNIGGNDHAYTFSGTTGTATDVLQRDEVSFFPINEASVDIYAHYPYSEGFSTVSGQQYFTIQSDQTTTDGYLKSDLMTASVTATRSQNADGTWTNNNDALLNFDHHMAKIILDVQTDETSDGATDLYIKSVEINGVKPRVPVTYNSSTKAYVVGAATTDVSGNSYDLQVLGEIGKTNGRATVLIPSQRYKVDDAYLTDLTKCVEFITIHARATYKDANNQTVTDENAELKYFFKGRGKLFRPGYVYTVTLRPGKNDYQLKDEYNVPGVELAKWASDSDDDENTCVYVNAAEEKLDLVGQKIQTGVSSEAATRVYNGSPHTLDTSKGELTVQLNDGTQLVEGDDYELHYSANVNAGTATVTIMGIGRYAGNLEQHFTITPKSISDATVSVSITNNIAYDGSSHQPTPTITDSEAGKTLTRYDYQTSGWTNNSSAGENTASVTITGIGNYTGSRTAYFSIPQAVGSVTFDDEFDTSGSIPTLTLIKPEGHEFDYVDNFKSVYGDGVLATNGVVSSDNSVLEVTSVDATNGKWTFHVKKAGQATLTFTMTNSGNYDYSVKPQCKIIITNGPALPIEYVSTNDIGSFSGTTASDINIQMAEDAKSESSCWLSWNSAKNHYMKFLSQYGLTINGEHYHLPSTYEWRSIFPGGCITWTKSYLDTVEPTVAFGVSAGFPRSTGMNVDDYTHHMDRSQTKAWRSDFYSPSASDDPNYNQPYAYNLRPIGSDYDSGDDTEIPENSFRCYALRFKGTTYCSAWRYDYVWSLDGVSSSIQAKVNVNKDDLTTVSVPTGYKTDVLTGNTLGRKSIVIRVKYLGPSFTGTVYDLVNKVNWDNYNNPSDKTKTDDTAEIIIRRFPCTGCGSGNDPAKTYPIKNRSFCTWYHSGSPGVPAIDPSNGQPRFRSVRLTSIYAQGDQQHTGISFSVRMFKDY